MGPSLAEGDLFDTAVRTSTNLFVDHALPYMAKKSVEMARYYGSKALRNKNLQKKAINYGLKKLTTVLQKVGPEALDQLSTKIRPNKNYKIDRKNLDGGSIQQFIDQLSGIANDPKKVKSYQKQLAKYAWEQAKIFGYRLNPGQLGIAPMFPNIVPMKGTTNLKPARIMKATPGSALIAPTGSGIIDKAKEKGTTSLAKGGIAGGPYRIDYEKGIELLKDPDLWKTPSRKEIADMKPRVAALKRSYTAVNTLGFKGSYTSFAKKIGAVHKPCYTFPGFGGGIDIHKAIGKLPKPKGRRTLPGHKYTGPYNNLENRVWYNKDGEIIHVFDKPTGKTDAVAMQHDIDYSICGDDKKSKHEADRKMVKSLDAIPKKERQWRHWLARNVINTKQEIALGASKNGKSRRVGNSNWQMNYINL